MHYRGTGAPVCARVSAILVTSVALVGTSLPHVAAAGTIACNIPAPCALFQNAQGLGVQGSSAKSNGSVGVTTFNATSLTNATNGVRGTDGSTNNNAYNAGVFGISNYGLGVKGQSTGGVGVFGSSSKKTGVLGNTSNLSGVQNAVAGIDLATNVGLNNGVFGSVTNGGWGVQGKSGTYALGGVEGVATTAVGVEGVSASGTGVYGTSSTGSGVYGAGYGSNVAVEGFNASTGDGIFGRSANGFGVEGYTTANDAGHFTNAGTGTGVAALATSGLALFASTSSGNGADIRGSYIGVLGRSNAFPLALSNLSGGLLFYVDGNGNVAYHGTLSSFILTRTGQTAVAFATRSTTTNVEDAGSAQLINGTASVPLDPAFAASIDLSAPYHVFLTPGGDTNGLYIASKSATAFVVRETKGGHSTLAFDYRILANAVGHARDRMAFVNPATLAQVGMPHASPATVRLPPAEPKLSAKAAANLRVR